MQEFLAAMMMLRVGTSEAAVNEQRVKELDMCKEIRRGQYHSDVMRRDETR